MSFPEGIDLVVYINLNIRTDRRDEIEVELSRLEVPKSKILRWAATRNTKNGALGCAMSHVAVLEHINTLSDNIKNILILEDDFNFTGDATCVKESLREFLTYSPDMWDMILLSYVVIQREDYNSLISRCLKSYLASGYLINRLSLPKILARFKEACDGLERTGDSRTYAIDNYWWTIMRDRKTFYFNKALGYQRRSYSNLDSAMCERSSRIQIANATLIRKWHPLWVD